MNDRSVRVESGYIIKATKQQAAEEGRRRGREGGELADVVVHAIVEQITGIPYNMQYIHAREYDIWQACLEGYRRGVADRK